MPVSGIQPAQGVTLQGTPTKQTGAGPVPFRVATDRKYEIASQDTLPMSAAQQLLMRVLEGTGYLAGVDLDVVATTAQNVAVTAYSPDAPWNAIQNVGFQAVGPDLITLTGYSLFLQNIYGGHGLFPLVNPAGVPGANAATTDPLLYSLVTGTGGGVGGSFRFHIRVPIALNQRNLIGLLGNQDQGTKYQLRTDLAPSGAVYTTPPTAQPTVIIARTLDYCTVPASVDARGTQQQQVPPTYGVLHMVNELRSEANPVSGASVNHFLRSLGNTDRVFILVFRDSTGARSDLMLPNRITMRVGADVRFSETSAHRRKVMRDRYLFDAPAGVLVYDYISDFTMLAGFELGDDWMNTSNVPNCQFEMAYPVFGNTPGSLTIITDQIVIPQSMDIRPYA
jgi:hypothetical protein